MWRKGGGYVPLALYAAQLALNLAWSPIFFKKHELGFALADVTGGVPQVVYRRCPFTILCNPQMHQSLCPYARLCGLFLHISLREPYILTLCVEISFGCWITLSEDKSVTIYMCLMGFL